ncbi:MAG: hypothetical protein F6J93_08590 [Oscillatoria sp. SIO1A7]|nr:hypothetical protein [Oscillatoria sp. SIO1A7]
MLAKKSLGLSLEYAYQPSSDREALSSYNNHICIACGAKQTSDRLPEAGVLQLGSIVFKTLPKPCSYCGYKNEIFFALNNLLHQLDPDIPRAEEAIAQAREQAILPDPFLEQELLASKVAIHQGKLEAAVEINKNIAARFPQLFLPFYNLGLIYGRQERYLESLEAYEEALKRNSEHSESLASKAATLMRLSRLQEAGTAYEQWRAMNPEEVVIMAVEEGMFGTVKVIDIPEFRTLWIDNQSQGNICKKPPANECEPTCRPGPSFLSENLFAIGFLLVGCKLPDSSGLVLGLGCGAGLLMNLACFPQMRLTVVEIDPVVIRLCLTFFPLVQHYIDAGRLEIVEADAGAFLSSNQKKFDFIQFDIYQGKNNFYPQYGSVEFVKLMKKSAPLLFANIIGKLEEPHLHRVLAAFDEAGEPIDTLYPGLPIDEPNPNYGNWIGLNQKVEIPADFIPFSDLSPDRVKPERLKTVRSKFEALKKNAVSRSQVLFYADKFNFKIKPYGK